MDDRDAINNIIKDFLDNASPEELQEFITLLEKRKKSPFSMGNMNIEGIASRFASGIQDQIGLTTEKITQSARGIVRDMILQYDPYISEEKVQMLLNEWVPDRGKTWKKLPHEVIVTMVSQFVAYGKGELTDAAKSEFPDGWIDKYWAFFPAGLQKIIKAYLKNRISKADFWDLVEAFLCRELKE
ncbi:MAG: hypothetical protein GY863_05715 [bacterium]|nr:hypothetical protein [bacterium]